MLSFVLISTLLLSFRIVLPNLRSPLVTILHPFPIGPNLSYKRTIRMLVVTPKPALRSLCQRFDPAYFAICESYLDTVRMSWAAGEDILDDAFGQFAALLVMLQDDSYAGARLDLSSLRIGLHFQSYVFRPL